jgi:hypothetical protein
MDYKLIQLIKKLSVQEANVASMSFKVSQGGCRGFCPPGISKADGEAALANAKLRLLKLKYGIRD